MTNVDVIIAGAGIWGSTLARRFAEAGRKVLVLEKRQNVGGNVRCEIDSETGIEIHSYGSHIFHTSLPQVWEFINRFTTFNGYQHKVLARYKGKTYFLPLGLTLVNSFFNVELTPAELPEFMADEKHSSAIFDAFFRGYTSKQWGRAPEDVDPSIIKRVPVRSTYDVNYFNDYCQGIPLNGYNSIFENLLNHPNITVKCGLGVKLEDGVFKVGTDELPNVPLYYSGPVDALFDYKLGVLPWRTLRFETERLDIADYQGTSVVNYTEAEVPYTRIHEFKHYHPELKDIMAKPKTIIMREYSAEWKLGDEPYYPIDNLKSRELLAAYKVEAAKIPNLVLGGRLGAYKYFDMDKSIESALKVEIN